MIFEQYSQAAVVSLQMRWPQENMEFGVPLTGFNGEIEDWDEAIGA